MAGATTLPSTGAIKFSDIRKMYAGGTTNNNIGYYYRGVNSQSFGTVSYPVVPNAASSGTISASGAISFSQFRGTAKEYNVNAISTDTAKYNLKSKFDDEFRTTATTNRVTIHGYNTYGYVTRLTINSGKTVYSDTTATPALTVGSFPSTATVIIENEGNIYGAGGAGGAGGGGGGRGYGGGSIYGVGGVNGTNGSDGGDGGNGGNGGAGGTALYATGASARVEVINNGYIKGGGGGGGGGVGNGGGGGGGRGARGADGAEATNWISETKYDDDHFFEYYDGETCAYWGNQWWQCSGGEITSFVNGQYVRGNLRENLDGARYYEIINTRAGIQYLGKASGGAGGIGGIGANGGAGGAGGVGAQYGRAAGLGGNGGFSTLFKGSGGSGDTGGYIYGNRTSSTGGTGGNGADGGAGERGGTGGAGGGLGVAGANGNLTYQLSSAGDNAGGAGGAAGTRGSTVGVGGAAGNSIVKTTNTYITNNVTNGILPAA